MTRKLFLGVVLMATACFASLILPGTSLVPTSSAMTVGQNDNRDMDRHMNRRRHRRHRRWHRRHRNMNANRP
ncbi:MAG TPA: hypothetical protein VGP81_02665 [Pyrinomonadaceae bacterium]|jgi:hypothetical protein|nr:hypothetical protein [Pyrinomonadaceae bacterium]